MRDVVITEVGPTEPAPTAPAPTSRPGAAGPSSSVGAPTPSAGGPAPGRADGALAAPAAAPPRSARADRRPAGTHPTAPAGPDGGMATAEYAIVTVAAAGFAGILLVILRSDEVRGLLLGIVRSALAI